MRPPGKATRRVVTMPNDPDNAPASCDGGYTCECRRCCEERKKLVRVGVRRARPVGKPQPRAA